jgi:hypothetical protein
LSMICLGFLDVRRSGAKVRLISLVGLAVLLSNCGQHNYINGRLLVMTTGSATLSECGTYENTAEENFGNGNQDFNQLPTSCQR